MKIRKSHLILASATALAAYGVFATTASQVSATSYGTGTTPAQVQFSAPTQNPTLPTVNPTNPTLTTPTLSTPGVTNPTGPVISGDPSLDVAPSLNFGVHQISSSSETYYAYALADPSNNAYPQYIQVQNNTGSAWSLSVEETGNFMNGTNSLTGASITFNAGTMKDQGQTNGVLSSTQSAAPEAILNASNGFQHIFMADPGAGVNLDVFPTLTGVTGSNDTADAALNTTSLNPTQKYDSDITLTVPGGSAIPGTYTTTLEWQLFTGPSFN